MTKKSSSIKDAKMNLKSYVKKTYKSLLNKWMTLSNLMKVKHIVSLPTYNAEKKLKSTKVMRQENVEWVKKFRELNAFYKLYGLDVEGSSSEDFIDYLSFMESRNIANRIGMLDSQVILLRDKFLFFKYMKSNNLPVPEVFGLISKGNLYDVQMNTLDWSMLSEEKEYFIKDIDGECASFVKKVKDYANLQQIKTNLKSNRYILQKKMVQSPEMDVLNSGAINTLRIVTINKDGNPYVLTSLLRVGTKKTGNVDNWAAGGIAVGIQQNGYLKEYGYFKPHYGTKTNIHPDSKIALNQFKVPMYKEALELACKAHRFFYNVRAIGWDVAISENGPVFIEGNDNWEISLMQVCDRPLKKEWIDALKN